MKRQAVTTSGPFIYTPSVWLMPSLWVLSLWGAFVLNKALGLGAEAWGIEPRTLSGLKGILFSPMLHADLDHLWHNMVPLWILGVALVYFYRPVSLKVWCYGWLLSGFFTWLIGRSSVHIGASGLVYVWFAYIFFSGIRSGYYRLTALSLAVILWYGGMVWMMFPMADLRISWEAHLSGFASGLLLAYTLPIPRYADHERYEWERPDYQPENDVFMQHFDDNGQFVPTPPPVPEEFLESEGSFFNPNNLPPTAPSAHEKATPPESHVAQPFPSITYHWVPQNRPKDSN